MSGKGTFPIPVPFGTSGDKELITITKRKDRAVLNSIGKSRYGMQDGTDIIGFMSIGTFEDGTIDQGTIDMVEGLNAASVSENGHGRNEYLMFKTGIIAPGSLPSYGQDQINGHKSPMRLFRRRKSEGDNDDNG